MMESQIQELQASRPSGPPFIDTGMSGRRTNSTFGWVLLSYVWPAGPAGAVPPRHGSSTGRGRSNRCGGNRGPGEGGGTGRGDGSGVDLDGGGSAAGRGDP